MPLAGAKLLLWKSTKEPGTPNKERHTERYGRELGKAVSEGENNRRERRRGSIDRTDYEDSSYMPPCTH